MAGAGRGRRSRRVREAPHRRAAAAAGVAPEDWRDWAGGLPDEVLETVARKVVAQTEAGWAAQLAVGGWTEAEIQEQVAVRKRKGNCLFVFARVCRGWRKAQLKVGGTLRTRVNSDVVLPGRVALVKWALAEGCPKQGRVFNMATEAAGYGHLELVQWLCGEGGFARNEEVIGEAALSGNLELVEWLRAEGCPWDASACTRAAEGGHLKVLQWLRARGCPWDSDTPAHAAARGRLEVLRWARANGCPRDAYSCATAAHSGHLETLQWLRVSGCPWDFDTCAAAAQGGQLKVLRWARENGCTWDGSTRDLAARKLGYTDDFGNVLAATGDESESDGDE